MNVKIVENESIDEDDLHLYCKTANEAVKQVRVYAEGLGLSLFGKKDGLQFKILPRDIYYVESIDKKTFAYLEKDVYEIPLKLYEFEELLEKYTFARATKSSIVNVMHIEKIVPQLNRNLLLTMKNGERLELSRRNVSSFKEKLRME